MSTRPASPAALQEAVGADPGVADQVVVDRHRIDLGAETPKVLVPA